MKKILLTMTALCLALALSACGGVEAEEEKEPQASPTAAPAREETKAAQVPPLPQRLEFVDGTPVLQVYVTEDDEIRQMELEEYVMGVLAGEMRADWPMEAMKAQAVLARTFVLKFLSEKSSMYPGADISTDINEAQAYDAEAVNSRVEKAVSDTAGQVLSYKGEFPYAWFHSHAGGMTDYPTQALDFADEDPEYIRSVESPESDKAPTAVKSWKVTFSPEEVVKAAREAGASVDALSSIALGEKSQAGRSVTLLINGQEVSAPRFRVAVGSTKLKSTLIDSVALQDGRVTFEGRGFGHGVGLSQWGAYGMAENGADYREIIDHYFEGVDVVSLWN